MSERGIDKPGWLMRQLADVQRESKNWPARMKRAVAERLGEADAVDEIDLDRVVRGLVRNARHANMIHLTPGKPLWSVIKDLTGLGSTSAKALCRRYGCDPDEPLKGE